jgi:F-type H+-transporting ATPase subunit delta
MSFSQVSGRYATALFELAREKGVLERVQADVERLGRELADREVAAFLNDARVPLERKRARLETLQGALHPLTMDFVRYLLDKRRLEVLRELQAAFKASLLRERNAVEGVVESPRPLGQGELAELAVALGARLGKEVELTGRVNTELIAGVRVFIDNKLIDQSALGRLEALRSRLLAAPVGQA